MEACQYTDALAIGLVESQENGNRKQEGKHLVVNFWWSWTDRLLYFLVLDSLL